MCGTSLQVSDLRLDGVSTAILEDTYTGLRPTRGDFSLASNLLCPTPTYEEPNEDNAFVQTQSWPLDYQCVSGATDTCDYTSGKQLVAL